MIFEQLRTVLDFEGSKLDGVLTLPQEETNRVAVMLHGGPGGTKEGPSHLYVRLADAFAVAGIASARFDFLGEGESDGNYVMTFPSQQVAQCQTIVFWLRSNGFERVGIVGESFGATAALGAQSAINADVLVLLWPAIWLFDGTFAPLIPNDWESELKRADGIDIDGTRVGRPFLEELLKHRDRENELRKVDVPTLFIHGDLDREVPVGQSRKAFDLLGDPKRLVVVPGADHCLRRPSEQEIAIRETTLWLATHLR